MSLQHLQDLETKILNIFNYKSYVHFRNLHQHISDLQALKKKLDHE